MGVLSVIDNSQPWERGPLYWLFGRCLLGLPPSSPSWGLHLLSKAMLSPPIKAPHDLYYNHHLPQPLIFSAQRSRWGHPWLHRGWLSSAGVRVQSLIQREQRYHLLHGQKQDIKQKEHCNKFSKGPPSITAMKKSQVSLKICLCRHFPSWQDSRTDPGYSYSFIDLV